MEYAPDGVVCTFDRKQMACDTSRVTFGHGLRYVWSAITLLMLHNPYTWAWRVVFLASAALPGIAFLFLEGRINAGPRYERLDPAPQEPALSLGNDPELKVKH